MNGWYGRVLRVDLTHRTYHVEKVNPSFAKEYIGGRGWAIKYLMDGMDPKADALSPENMLIFATGPLTGSPAPTGNRYMVVTKSPLTGVLTNSNSGGDYPTWMKRTGFDLFIFEGCAESPVYLWVDDDRIEIRRAADGGIRRALIKFDVISNVPADATVLDAVIELYGGTLGEIADVSAYRLLEPWDESSATWNMAAAGTPW
ncbi:MAG: aldehyde ferredoxin oxidoreductase N-terminal domain-containing protein, partial [Candidatus Promineifilaceae bacterium]